MYKDKYGKKFEFLIFLVGKSDYHLGNYISTHLEIISFCI